MFNPIPKDAPEFFSDRAHYVCTEHKGSWGAEINDDLKRSRYYLFKIGRSEKEYWFRDKYIDDNAMSLLNDSRRRKVRLVVKGYLSPAKDSPVTFIILTHFGIYHKPNRSEYQTFNPDGGEIGFYRLKTE